MYNSYARTSGALSLTKDILENEIASSSEKTLVHIHRIARIGVAATWIYHGLIPKVIFRDWSEMTLLHDLGVDIQFVPMLLQNMGYAEIAFGVLILTIWHGRWQLWATIGIMIGGLLSIAHHSPATFHAAFNPVSLNGLMLVLAVIGLLSQPPRTIKNQAVS